MAKNFGLLAHLRRNDRIVKAAFSGALLYALTIVAATPMLNAAAGIPVVMTLAPQQLKPAAVQTVRPSPKTVTRTSVVNRPTYQAYLRERNCLATAIYFEARGETVLGQRAVAEVVLARTRTPGRPKTICGVVYQGSNRKTGCQFSFTCDGKSDRVRNHKAWARAVRIATHVMRTGGKVDSLTKGATFYHADYVSPGWASRMVKVASIGQHVFYRPQRGRHL